MGGLSGLNPRNVLRSGGGGGDPILGGLVAGFGGGDAGGAGESIQEGFDALRGKRAEDAADEQVARALEADALRRDMGRLLRDDAAPLRELRNSALSDITGVFGLNGEPNQLFRSSPEFTRVRDAALRPAEGLTGNRLLALQERAGNIASGEYDNFTNRLLTTAGYGSNGLNNSNRLLQANTDARASLLNTAGASAASGVVGSQQSTANAAGGLSSLIGMFSDPRLKENVIQVGQFKNYPVYKWDWTDEAKLLVGDQPNFGVMSTDVLKINPDAVDTSGTYHKVDYSKL